jgi:hypothetical protein
VCGRPTSGRDPDAVADAKAHNAGAELVDDAGAVVVRDGRFSGCAAGCAAARLPVGWVHARHEHADPHLAFSRLGNRSLHELEYGWIAGTPVGDRVGFANSGGLVFVDESAKEIPSL